MALAVSSSHATVGALQGRLLQGPQLEHRADNVQAPAGACLPAHAKPFNADAHDEPVVITTCDATPQSAQNSRDKRKLLLLTLFFTSNRSHFRDFSNLFQ